MYKFVIPDIKTKQKFFFWFFWNIGQVLMTLINWLLKPKCMLRYNVYFSWSWCAVAVERKRGGSCGCSSSLVFFLLPLSLPVLPRFFNGLLFSPLSSLKRHPFCNISLRLFPAFSSLFFPLFFLSFLPFRSLSLHLFLSKKMLFLSFGLSFLSQKTAGLSLSVSLPFFLPFTVFFLFFFFPPPLYHLFGIIFIGAGGVGSTLPHPIAAHVWGACLLLYHGTNRGGQ